jgi:hypothetical protein
MELFVGAESRKLKCQLIFTCQLSGANGILNQLAEEMKQVAVEIKQAIERSQIGLGEIRKRCEERKIAVMKAYETILRDLQKSKIDGEEFIRLRRQIQSS